jgi:hypothetical protein
MDRPFEFRRANPRSLAVLYGVRLLVVASILYWTFALVYPVEPGTGHLVSTAGALFTSIWFYCNVIQAKHEIQELFVPPFQLTAGWEFMLIGPPCMMGGHFL